MSRGGPRGGGPRGGSMGGRPGGSMGGRPGGSMGGRPRGGSMGGRPGGSMPRMGMPMGGGMPRRSNPMATFLVIAIIIVASAISALGDNILWLAIIAGVVAIVGMLLYYKYKKDRAEAYETNQMLNADLETLGSGSSKVEDLANKYE